MFRRTLGIFGGVLVLALASAGYIQYKERPQIRVSQNWSRFSGIDVGYIGDSLSTGMVRSHRNLTDAIRLIQSTPQNLVIGDFESSSGPVSLFEMMEKKVPLRIINYSRPGSDVFVREVVHEPNAFVRWLLNIPHLKKQVKQLLSRSDFPDLVVVWTGHMEPLDWNDLKRVRDQGELKEFNDSRFAHEKDRDEALRKWIAQKFSSDYEAQMQKILSRAQKENRPFSLVIFALYNWRNLTDITEEIQRMKRSGFQGFTEARERLDPEGSLKLYERLNQDLEKIAEDLTRVNQSKNIHIIFNANMASMKMGVVDIENDGMHPNVSGMKKISEQIARAIQPEIERIH
ncbi:MAG: hypothetical protein JWQ35_2325 [Bacteriovoracaceae bacterium]|nr:hypothetical protein [Bacteriovoracaceae bacterium]